MPAKDFTGSATFCQSSLMHTGVHIFLCKCVYVL